MVRLRELITDDKKLRSDIVEQKAEFMASPKDQ